MYFDLLSQMCFRWVQCPFLFVPLILFLILKVLVLCLSLFWQTVHFEGHFGFCVAFRIYQVCLAFVLGYPLRFPGHLVFVLAVQLSHFFTKSCLLVMGGRMGGLGCSWSLSLECCASGCTWGSFSLSLCVECVIERTKISVMIEIK